ncbi:TIGR03757 family integrating conjugative element protein [Pseudomonas aeruginosa]|uniref:TIGR03757 family integrating conjugative element protein n=1 Tax=Pseudomonas aeruginosa TaxID=287 RepID=UPI0029CF8494|nr:TIGR03757 family integrating conjugative element protein [Pseudomonas aeruginosa]HEJ1398596.1 TIGR03757 family integrating conjugative element protein [Pseudomonas aeruginosa]
MPAPVFKASPRLPTISIAPGLWAVLFMFTQTTAADVLVVTDSHHPVQASVGVRVIELDLPARIEAKIATDLPNDPDKATTLVRQRLRDGGDALQRRIGHAYQGVADAWGLGIAKIPAVVVDRRYVVYGEPDVPRAVARINAYRSTQP